MSARVPQWTAKSATRRAFVVITILAITGTLYGCGRYGSPVRAVPDPIAAETEVDLEPNRLRS